MKLLRTKNMTNILKKEGLSRPSMDNDTRWSSVVKMLEDLNKLKNFCKDYSTMHKRLALSDITWDQISESIAALKHVQITTLSLQKDQLLPGDFYGSWIRCKLYLKKLNSSIAKNLLKQIDVREKKLFENDLLLAALYLDPRYLNLILDKENESNPYSKESRARKKLLEIWSHLKKIEKRALPATSTVQNSENNMVHKSFL